MTKEQMIRFTKRVSAYTPGGGCNPLLDLLVDAVTRENPQGVERITDISHSLQRLSELAGNAALIAGDPDFIAASSDTYETQGDDKAAFDTSAMMNYKQQMQLEPFDKIRIGGKTLYE